MRSLLLLAALSGTLPSLAQTPKWTLEFFHDKDESSLNIIDLDFPSPQRGVAVGILTERGREKATALVTSDGGRSWSYVRLKDQPTSLFFLNENLGWMVARSGIWRTEVGPAHQDAITLHGNEPDLSGVVQPSPNVNPRGSAREAGPLEQCQLCLPP